MLNEKYMSDLLNEWRFYGLGEAEYKKCLKSVLKKIFTACAR